ncbi:MAG: hypothetical protein PHP85_13330 [Gallionella sp.]|nr:hypothetical protein [Gallionella sp.]
MQRYRNHGLFHEQARMRPFFYERPFSILLVCLLPFQQAHAGDVPEASGPECVMWCGNGSDASDNTGGSENNSSEGSNFWQNLEERARVAAERRRTEGVALNAQGNTAYSKRSWVDALRLYRQALQRIPGDLVILQNIKNAEIEISREGAEKKRQDDENKRLEEQRREQAEYRKRMGKLVGMMPEPDRKVLARNPVPLPGFTGENWKAYQQAQSTVDQLYARLNREGALSDADSTAFYAALRRRNALWSDAADQPLDAAERDRLRLSLPVIINKARLSLSAMMGGTQADGKPNAAQPDRRVSSADRNSPDDAITNAFVADFFSDKIVEVSESAVGDAVEGAHGELMKDRFEKLLGLGKVATRAAEGDMPGAGAESVDFIISRMPEPMTPHAEFAVEGGRMYSNLVYQALNRFMVDAMKVAGGNFDAEAFLQRFEASLTPEQKGVKKWIQFGE